MFLKRWLKNSVPFLQERSCRISVSCNLCGDWVLRFWVGFALGLGVLFLQTATVLSVSESATPSLCINWCYCRARCILFGFNKGQRFFYLRWNITQFNYIRPDPLWLQYRKTILSQSHRGNSSRKKFIRRRAWYWFRQQSRESESMAEYLCIYGTLFGWNSKGRFLMKPRMSQRKKSIRIRRFNGRWRIGTEVLIDGDVSHQTVINGVRRLSLFHKHSIVIKYSPLSSLIFFEQCIG